MASLTTGTFSPFSNFRKEEEFLFDADAFFEVELETICPTYSLDVVEMQLHRTHTVGKTYGIVRI